MRGLFDWLVQSVQTVSPAPASWTVVFRLDHLVWSWRKPYTSSYRRKSTWRERWRGLARLMGWAFALACIGIGGAVAFLAGKGWQQEHMALVWVAAGVATLTWLGWQWSQRRRSAKQFPQVWHLLPLSEEKQEEEMDIEKQSTPELRRVLARSVDGAIRIKKGEVGAEEIVMALMEQGMVIAWLERQGIGTEQIKAWMKERMRATTSQESVRGWSVSGRALLVGMVANALAHGRTLMDVFDAFMGACAVGEAHNLPRLNGMAWRDLAQGCLQVRAAQHPSLSSPLQSDETHQSYDFSWDAWREIVQAWQMGKAICLIGDRAAAMALLRQAIAFQDLLPSHRACLFHGAWKGRGIQVLDSFTSTLSPQEQATAFSSISSLFQQKKHLVYSLSDQADEQSISPLFTCALDEGKRWYVIASSEQVVPMEWQEHPLVRLVHV